MEEMQIRSKISKLKEEHYDNERKVWMADKKSDTIASPEQTIEFQTRYRLLKFDLQILSDEAEVKSDETPLQKRTLLKALIDRRNHPELWPYIGKTEKDGMLFTIGAPIEFDEVFCNCTDEELVNQFDEAAKESGLELFGGRYRTYREDADVNKYFYFKAAVEEKLDELRQQHTLHLQGVRWTGLECSNPKTEKVKVRQDTHTIGNIACQACVTILSDKEESLNDIASAIGKAKTLEPCPKFLSVLRAFPMEKYLDSMLSVKTSSGKVCYAGLMHTQMKFDTYLKSADGKLHDPKDIVLIICKCSDADLKQEYIDNQRVTDQDISTLRLHHSQSITALDRPNICPHPGPSEDITALQEQNVVILTSMCDTCGYTTRIVNEYNAPEPIQPGESLAI